jgi:hypothetical protein
MLEHGGRLLQAVSRYGLPRERWLDLSTGINPTAWQGATIPISSWNRLPEDEDGLIEAARSVGRRRPFKPCRSCASAPGWECRFSATTSMGTVGKWRVTRWFHSSLLNSRPRPMNWMCW